MFNAQEKSMQDFHISTYPFPHCTDFKHSLPSIFPCSCFSANQRPAGCPERRFLTGRRVGWASGRLRNHSYPATYFIFDSLRPSYFSFAKSLSRNSDTSSISSLSIKSSFISTSRSVWFFGWTETGCDISTTTFNGFFLFAVSISVVNPITWLLLTPNICDNFSHIDSSLGVPFPFS